MENQEILKKVVLFRDLDNNDLATLASIATEERFPMGYTIFEEGSMGDSMYVVKYGTASVIKNHADEDEEIVRLGTGEYFGDMALIQSETRSATLIAGEKTELIKIRRNDLEKLFEADQGFAYRLTRALALHLSNRLRQTTTDLAFMKKLASRKSN